MARGQKLEIETEAMINWIENSHFVLSLNLHAGSEVASYPYDDGVGGGYSKVENYYNIQYITNFIALMNVGNRAIKMAIATKLMILTKYMENHGSHAIL